MALTIMIGLGGLGSEIIGLIQNIMDIQCRHQQGLNKRVRLAVVDTDVTALKTLKEQGFRGTIIQISDNMTVEDYLHYDKRASDWFPQHAILGRKTLTEGAGQVRAISRLALNMALKKGSFSPLYEAIDSMHVVNGMEGETSQATRVIIVSSLAGGTGSGIFLPLAMHLRSSLKRRYRSTEPIFKGFFIMPSLFEYRTKNGDSPENISMRANGYAAIKELDAFSKMRDGQIKPHKYSQVKIELTDMHGKQSLYRESPYDMCFLFEKQNQDDLHLKTFEEAKQNIANCIWMQTLNPMMADKSSGEDNVLRVVSASNGKGKYERFAGMGISTLEYPYQELAEYLSLVIADKMIARDWYAADQYYEASDMEYESLGDAYIAFAKNKTNRPDEWTRRIEIVKREAWIDNYEKAVDRFLNDNQIYLDDAGTFSLENINKNILAGRKSIQEFQSQRNEKITRQTNKLLQELIPTWDEEKIQRKELQPYQMEKWLGYSGGEWHTPIENRYFLYTIERWLQDESKKAESEADKQLEKSRKSVQEFEDTAKKVQKEIEDSKFHRLRKMCAASSNDLVQQIEDAWNEACNTISKAATEKCKANVYNVLLEQVRKISGDYQMLVKSFQQMTTTKLDQTRSNMIERFNSMEGTVKRMVCTSKRCLEQMEKMARSNGELKEDRSDFAKVLLRMALGGSKTQQDHARLLRFWCERYQDAKHVGTRLDMDIMTAMKQEAIWELQIDAPNGRLNEEQSERVQHYIENIIVRLREDLTKAFIRVPAISNRHIMEMNVYPNDVPNEYQDMMLHRIVETQLKEKQGAKDTTKLDPQIEIQSKQGSPRYKIDFYRAFFGVSAGEVAALLNKEANSPILSGECYESYVSIVNYLDSVNRDKNFLSPHLDRRWHKVKEMPDLSLQRDQDRLVDEIKAMLYGLQKEKIKWTGDEYQLEKRGDYSYQNVRPKSFYDLVARVEESTYIAYTLLDELESDTAYGREVPSEKELERIPWKHLEAYVQDRRRNDDEDENGTRDLIYRALLELLYQSLIVPKGIHGPETKKRMLEACEAIIAFDSDKSIKYEMEEFEKNKANMGKDEREKRDKQLKEYMAQLEERIDRWLKDNGKL